MGSPLTALDTSLDGFCRDLEALDNMSSRTCDTVHVFYVRAGQKTSEEILSNVVSYLVAFLNYDVGFFCIKNLCYCFYITGTVVLFLQLSESTVSPHFLEFLQSLGWAVNVFQHPGWTGHISTSWRVIQPTAGNSVFPLF
jgi:hypothetical protein